MSQHRARPVVFSFSGHDPSGGAGIQADIETVISHHCHSVGVITALTEQDTHNVKKLLPQQPENIISQSKTLLDDLSVDVFKIGLIGHHDTATAIATILQQHPAIPVVLDPILAAGGGTRLSNDELIKAIRDLLLPHTTVLTPNSEEARQLTGLTDLTECGLKLLELGCKFVLITGTHEDSAVVSNLLFHDNRLWETYHWDRLPDSYHGSGCTLASSIASLIAQGLAPLPAIEEAQEYTWNSLSDGFQPGNGQHIPNRFFWLEETT
jgi:hydroxymethylpyrimidine/phosphomethylpyrimidine kinase